LKNIMLVDDSIFILKQLSQILLAEGYKVLLTASNGKDCVDKYRVHRKKIDLITLDITMPVLDGISALNELIKINPDVKVIMISALGNPQIVKKALISGAKGFIIKPLNREKVLERINNILF